MTYIPSAKYLRCGGGDGTLVLDGRTLSPTVPTGPGEVFTIMLSDLLIRPRYIQEAQVVAVMTNLETSQIIYRTFKLIPTFFLYRGTKSTRKKGNDTELKIFHNCMLCSHNSRQGGETSWSLPPGQAMLPSEDLDLLPCGAMNEFLG
jgi:hypothetical protein